MRLLLSSIIVGFSLTFVSPVYAASDPPPVSDFFDDWITNQNLDSNLTSIDGIINTLVPVVITLAGLILFIMLIAGGFQMLTSASNPDAAKAGQQRITTALLGFLIIFAAYWIVEIVEIILGINIFGNG